MSEVISKETAEEIFTKHSNFVYRTVLFLTKSKELADDITQETFIQVFRKYYTFDSSKPLQPWLYKIAVPIGCSNDFLCRNLCGTSKTMMYRKLRGRGDGLRFSGF